MDMDMDSLARVPEGCISNILSLTSPMDTTRFSIISHRFKSASDSDNVWERFLPPDYQQIISTSVSPVLYTTKKHLYFNLCHSPILLHEGNTKEWKEVLHARSQGTFTIMGRMLELDIAPAIQVQTVDGTQRLTARGLRECHGPPTHKFFTVKFSEVAKLKCPGWIHIRGKIKTQMLSSNTAYVAYLVFHLAERLNGLESSRTVIRFVDPQVENCVIKTVEGSEKLESEGTGKIAKMRGTGWMEIEMGNFYNGEEDDREVEAWLIEINNPGAKSGLIIEGIEFRPV